MSFLDSITKTIHEAQEKEKREKQRKLEELKEIRAISIPIIEHYVEKHKALVTFLDTDAYVYTKENGRERGIYIKYGKDDAAELDDKIDKFIHNYESAAKHKASGLLGKSASIFMKIGDGYNTLDKDIEKASGAQPIKKHWSDGKALQLIKINTNPNTNSYNSLGIQKKSTDKRKAIPEYIKEAVKKRAHYKCENPTCRISDRDTKLEFHHINGNHSDNRLENIAYLCPNCHSVR